MQRLIISLLGLSLSMSAASQGFDRPTGKPFASRSEVIATQGMAATSQPLATQIAPRHTEKRVAARSMLRSPPMRRWA